ncbi:hypothetical protein AMS68_000734 [Peltaster fructicola]|uniref:Btz domain-containing protein n=1 Tax=Peltaster fructicola TaxID=286661 RepID=A0A6H0XKE9_9PEZI|nr:hypothetical protein AMS68_000734 [Peltaster fructicola]
MAAGRSSKNLVGRRRRVGEEEEDDGPVMVEDSQSEGSILSDNDGDEDASTFGDGQVDDTRPSNGDATNGHSSRPKKTNKRGKQNTKEPSTVEQRSHDFKTTADTEAMMQGLQITDTTQEATDYSNGQQYEPGQIATVVPPRQPQGKQKKEHEEYKKQRDADPAFIPNRGNFFMHDTRGQYNGGPLPFRGGGAGRGRGRGMQNGVGHTSEAQHRPSEQLWKHDLHDSINEGAVENYDQGGKSSARLFTRLTTELPAASAPISFSSTKLLGRVQVRVSLPGMPKAITYAEVPLRKYVKLPDHRPPLRRDKPLRILLPNIGPKYIFPATERSFIFIPRQMRPNQRGYANSQRNATGYGYSSRRTSMYGGSVYSASIAASRRSSIARDREGMFSPGSYASGFQPPNRPVVRLSRSGQLYDTSTPPVGVLSGQHTPVHQVHTYPLPQQPALHGTPTTTVQHPRPQKAISVSGIESPAALTQRHTPADQQPFHSQLPMHLNEQVAGPMPYYSPRQQYAYPTGMGQVMSPLSQIPEQGPGYHPPQQMYSQPYYYPMPMYMVPQQQQGYMYPPTGMPQTVPPPPGQSDQQASGMLAHESNGMVFYMPAAEAGSASTEQYQPAEGFVPNYAVPGLPPTPAPDQSSYYYPNNGYYQQR